VAGSAEASVIRRIHTTYDLLEAHLITAMLREHGVDAWLFDADFVRQDWFKSIAFGGYRIVANDDSIADANEILRQYKNGGLALPEEHRLVCPRCSQEDGSGDPQPRRNVFLAILLFDLVAAIAFSQLRGSEAQIASFIALQFGLYFVLPWLAIWYFKWPSRCDACGHRWREPRRYRHAELAKMAESEVSRSLN
jgi:hypothetical protein